MSAIDFEQPLEPQIRQRLVREAVAKLGYTFNDERLARVADGMRAYMDKGVPANFAFAGALDDELLMYGDSQIDPSKIVGLMNV